MRFVARSPLQRQDNGLHNHAGEPAENAAIEEAPRLLLHFFDHEIKKFHSRPMKLTRERIRQEQQFFLRLGVLSCCDFVAIPASSYFEAKDTRDAIGTLPGFVESGWIRLFGRTRSLAGFREHKQAQYSETASRHPLYFSRRTLPGARQLESAWIVKEHSTTEAITKHWVEAIDSNDRWVKTVLMALRRTTDPEDVLRELPTLL